MVSWGPWNFITYDLRFFVEHRNARGAHSTILTIVSIIAELELI